MPSPQDPDAPHWAAALEHYHCDRLEDAYREARSHGLGEAGSLLRWYRIIEAETLTRRRSQQIEVTPWLRFEYVPGEVRELRETLCARALAACEQVAERLGWTHVEDTLIAILAEETEAPWAANPYGYCVSKESYEKICLPSYLIDEPEEFSQAVAHEYAHVISMSLADGYAPRWLEEAVSVLLERKFEREAWEEFVDGSAPWLDPYDLEMVLEGRNDETDEGEDEVWLAYQQAGWIGLYLVTLGDERRLGRLLREVAHEGIWRNLVLALRGQERIDGALKSTFGTDSRSLFRDAYAWMRTQRQLAMEE
ncbi:MAG: hypothetical protein ACO1SV_27225 [Fimbriimonas sp.]